VDAAQDSSSASPVSMDFFQSPFVSVRSNASDGCLSLASQPLASVSALLVDSAPTAVSMASTSKVIHQEATASTSHIDWNFGTDSDKEQGFVWAEEGKDYPWEGDEVFPRLRRRGMMQLLLCICPPAWSFTQVLDGMSWSLLSFL
jgi:hypothetical protein